MPNALNMKLIRHLRRRAELKLLHSLEGRETERLRPKEIPLRVSIAGLTLCSLTECVHFGLEDVDGGVEAHLRRRGFPLGLRMGR